MKFTVVVLACVVAAVQGANNPFSYVGNNYRSQPSRNQPFRSQPFKPQPAVIVNPSPITPVRQTYAKATYSGDAGSANIVKFGNEINPDGGYSYFYETDNGIAAQEQGTPRNFGGNPPVVPDVAQGSFSWTSPEGVPIVISYIADENGYQPQGDAIPTSPPIPPQIARALEYIARNAPRK